MGGKVGRNMGECDAWASFYLSFHSVILGDREGENKDFQKILVWDPFF